MELSLSPSVQIPCFCLFIGLFMGAIFLVALSFLDCTQTMLAVALLTLAVSSGGFVFSGFFINHMDIAPVYAGTLMGISNGVAAVSGFIAPTIAAIMTTSVSQCTSLHSL